MNRKSNRSEHGNSASRAGAMAAILLALLGGVLVAVPPVSAGTLTWDKDPTTEGIQEGAGPWNGTTNTWRDSAGNNTNWIENSDVVIGNGGAGNTITISGITPTVNSMTFAPISAQYTLSGGTINLANAQTLFAVSVNPIIYSVLAGAGTGLLKTGGGRLLLKGANTYSGATTLQGGGTSQLQLLDGGSLLNTSSIDISSGAYLILDNNASTVVSSDRLGASIAINMNGGTLQVLLKANNNLAETTGALSFNSGYNVVQNSPASPGYTNTLTFASLNRSAGAAVVFYGTGLGVDNSNMVKFAAAPTLDGGGLIGGWALHRDGSAYNWARYDNTLGVQAYNGYQTSATDSDWGTTDNVKVTTTPSLTANRTIHSLYLSNNGTANAGMTLNGNTLTVLSGGILANGVNNSNPYLGQNNATRGTITSGTSGASDLIIVKTANSWWMNIGATIADNAGGGAVSVVAQNDSATAGILLYSPSNSYSGDTFVNSGYFGASANEVIPNGVGKGDVIVKAVGIFVVANSVSETVNGLSGTGTITLGTGASLSVGDNNATSVFAGAISSSGALTKIGMGILTLTGTNAYSGGTIISNGVLAIANTNSLGSGAITLSGGTLSNTVTMASGLGLTNTFNLTSAGSLNTAAGNLLLTGAITNNGSMTKSGANGLLIYGAKTGTGALTVSAGYLGGTNAWAGTVTNQAMITAGDTNSTGILTVTNLVMAENSTYLWNYDVATQDVINVTGTLTLPTVATVQVSRVAGTLPMPAVLATFGSVSGNTSLPNWKVVGDDGVRADTHVIVNNGQLQLVSSTGMILRIY